MYSERNRQPSARRADDAFLRRMLGGELASHGTVPQGDLRLSQEESAQKPLCDGSYPSGGSSCTGDCPNHGEMPSLAMVYAPRQCFRNLLEPASALERGSLFAELILPLSGTGGGRPNCTGGEVKPCK